jgi:prepilin-type N-terminal cleavage/methylation domain-containing protein
MLSARTGGFTLVELMIVVVIIGTLATIVVPSYRGSLSRARSADVIARVEAINLALKDYEADHTQPPPEGTGPDGAAPAWLATYAPNHLWRGPGLLTFQVAVTASSAPPVLLVHAGSNFDEQQILLATARVLGSRAYTMGGGSQLAVTLTN